MSSGYVSLARPVQQPMGAAVAPAAKPAPMTGPGYNVGDENRFLPPAAPNIPPLSTPTPMTEDTPTTSETPTGVKGAAMRALRRGESESMNYMPDPATRQRNGDRDVPSLAALLQGLRY